MLDKRLLLVLVSIVFPSMASLSLAEESVRLMADDDRSWYRGNMHTHSHWSDGDDYLESIALWYRDQGYNFLVFTDHNVLPTTERWVRVNKTKGGHVAYQNLVANFPGWVEQRGSGEELEVRLRQFLEVANRLNEDGRYLLVQGEEISDQFLGRPIHLNAHNVERLIPPQGGRSVLETIENNVEAVLSQRKATGRPMIVHLNHPNFGFAVTAEDLMRVRDERFFEVYNGHLEVSNQGDDKHVGTERLWDIVLAQRIAVLDMPIMYGLAVDDGHNYHNIPSRASEPGRGWVEVLANDLTIEALIEALEKGYFFSSSGVQLSRIEESSEGIEIEVDPVPGEEYTIEFIGTRSSAPLTGKPVSHNANDSRSVTHEYSSAIGELLQSTQGKSASYQFTGDEYYVRARVTSSALHPNPSEIGDKKQAWAQPIRGPAAPSHRH